MDDDKPWLHLVPEDYRGDFTPPGRQPPHLDDLGFDPRLMSADRLLRLAGDRALVLEGDPGLDNEVFRLRCRSCGGSTTVLTDRRGEAYPVTGTQLLMDVLRHMVMHHDIPLSGEKEGEKWAGITAVSPVKKKKRWLRRR